MKENRSRLLFNGPCLTFYELSVTRLPNQKQTACESCPGNLVANTAIGKCWCPGNLVFNDQWDYCE